MQPKLGLALGAGAMRGMAHIGVLRVLERENIPIDYMAGCSIGSLIGALYCSGQTTGNMLKLAKHLKPRYWLDFVVPKLGVISGIKIMDTVRFLTQNKSFADLRIPLAVVATELRQGRETVFSEGNLAEAVRASISIPGIFIPFERDGGLYVDGAVLNSTPMDVVRRMGADIVVGVDLSHTHAVVDIKNMFDVILQSIEIMERQMLKQKEHYCDLLIRPHIGHISSSSFDTVDECVALGEQAAQAVMDDLRRLLADRRCSGADG